MSSSRRLKFRTVPRAPRYPCKKHAEPVLLANKFQELIEQDELSPSHSRLPAQRPVYTAQTTSMAQHLQDLLEESVSGNKYRPHDRRLMWMMTFKHGMGSGATARLQVMLRTGKLNPCRMMN